MTTDVEIQAFFERHTAHPGGVIVVWYLENERDCVAIFSTYEKAKAFMDVAQVPCMAAPYVVDEPDYGDVPVASLH